MARVLILCEYATLNGGEYSLLAVLSNLRAAGFEVTVAGPRDGALALELARQKIPHVALALHDETGRRFPLDECRRRVRKLIETHRPQLLHANSLSMSRLVGPVVQDLAIPSIGHLRDIVRVNRTVIDDLNCHARLLAVSDATRLSYLALGLDSDRTSTLYNGVDLMRFRPRTASGYLHAELGLPGDARLVGAIGQISLRKGFDLFTQAAEKIAKTFNDVHFVLVGQRYSQKQESIDFEGDLRQRAANPPLAGRFHFLGLRNDIPHLLNELTLLIHPARQEPLGRVLLEAASSGLAIVATDVGGTREIFPPAYHAAELIPAGDPDAISRQMTQLLTNQERRKKLATAARRRVEDHFDVNIAARGLASHYASAVSKHPS